MAFLNPKSDNHGVTRVGGRLDRSIVHYDMFHPGIIPKRIEFGMTSNGYGAPRKSTRSRTARNAADTAEILDTAAT